MSPDLPIFSFLFTVVAYLYGTTLYNGVPGGDAGEVLAESCHGGVAHPPGYPLLIGLTNAGVYVGEHFAGPGGVPPYLAANLLNSLFGVLSAVFVGMSVGRVVDVSGDHSSSSPMGSIAAVVCGCCAGVIFATTPVVWLYAIGFEVFALNNMLSSLLVYLTVFITTTSPLCVPASKVAVYSPLSATARVRLVGVGALVCGLGLANQHTIVLFEAPLILWIMYVMFRCGDFSLSNIVRIGLFFLCGISPYLHLYFVSAHPRQGSWGDTSTAQGLLTHILRKEYGTLKLSPMELDQVEGFVERTVEFFKDELAQLGGYLMVLFPIGLAKQFYDVFFVRVETLLPSPRLGDPQAESNPAKRKPKKSRPGKQRRKSATPDQQGAATEQAPNTSATQDKYVAQLNAARAHLVNKYTAIPLMGCLVVYFGVFHSLANLPLSDPMAREVHRRFWMQPHIVVCIVIGCSLSLIVNNTASGKNNGSTRTTRVYMMIGCIVVMAAGQVARHAMLFADSTKPFAESTRTVQRYGSLLLESIVESNAILLSHNDLNWNTARYLQVCERRSPEVVHLSLQLMPYPWFHDVQEPLYRDEDVVFPKILPGTSTSRHSKRNMEYIGRFVEANLNASRPIYLDIHAVNDMHIGNSGVYADGKLRLVPTGLLFQVFGVEDVESTAALNRWETMDMTVLHKWRVNSRTQIESVLAEMLDAPPLHQFPAGTWEHAATTISWDAVYQRGIFLLSSNIEILNKVKAEGASIDAEKFHLAQTESFELLYRVVTMLKRLDEESKYLSFRVTDVLKNCALSGAKLLESISMLIKSKKQTLGDAVSAGQLEQELSTLLGAVRVEVRDAIEQFVEKAPNDPDVGKFENMLRLPHLKQDA